MLLQDFGLLFFNIAFAVFNSIITLFLRPIILGVNLLLSTFIEDYQVILANALNRLDVVINDVIIPNLAWVINLFPPFTFGVVLLFLGSFILIYTYEATYAVSIKVLRFIKSVVPMA